MNALARCARRLLLRDVDGGLRDPHTRCEVTIEELIDGLRAGKTFRVRRDSTGADCTGEVLGEVLRTTLFGNRDRRGHGLWESLSGPITNPSRCRE
ncbi:hypothetical protein [Amycolatopsis sp. cmx-11-32]|uniref:hypothetical protein n=1 Tax=Amycolatopsis sp. cmx-11-32 TaxID=2785796 RepID=UPI0039E5BF1C